MSDSELRDIFIADTAENIEIITDKILASELEKKLDNETANLIMRICHSIKGAARLLKLPSIAQIFHNLETLLSHIQSKKLNYEKFVVDLFLESMDTLRSVLEEMRNDANVSSFFELDMINQKLAIILTDDNQGAAVSESETEIEMQESAEQSKNIEEPSGQQIVDLDLDSIIDSAAVSAANKKPTTVSAASSQPQQQAAAVIVPSVKIPQVKEPQETFDYNSVETDILADFISESTELIENLSNDFVEMENSGSAQSIDKIFRSMHTLKGGAGFVGLVKFQELAHICENLLDDVRNGKYNITRDIISELLKATDVFTNILNLLNSNSALDSILIADHLTKLKILRENKGVMPNFESTSASKSAQPVQAPQQQVKQQPVQPVKPAQQPAKPSVQPQQIKSAPSPQQSKPQPAAPQVAAKPSAEIKKDTETPDQLLEFEKQIEQIKPQQNINIPIDPKLQKLAKEFELAVQTNKDTDDTQQSAAKQQQKDKDADKKADAAATGLTQQTLRVELSKLDNLMNLVGELVISKIGFSSQLEKISVYIDEIETNLHHINLHLDNAALKNSLDLYEDFQKKLNELINKYKSIKEFRELYDLVKSHSSLFGEENIINNLYENWKTMVVEYQQISSYYIELYKSSTLLASKIGLLAKDLQENVMQTRMLPISSVFTKYKRTVRDLSQKINKDIRLELYGEETEMDKNIIEKIGDPLTHIIRNSIDHGIETPAERVAAGKPRTGVIKLSAYNKGGNVFIEVEDDGRGINVEKVCAKAVEKGIISPERLEMMSENEKLNLIFLPGFSTAEKVTEISGRGVGMDVVRENITKLKGVIDISTRLGHGTKLIIKLPLTLAILQVLQIKEENNIFAIPSNNIVEVFSIKLEELEKVKNVFMLNNRGKYIPVYFMTDILGLQLPPVNLKKDTDVVVVGFGETNIGLIVSEIVKKEEVVIKNLGDLIKKVKFVSGATIEGDGTITLILNIPEIIDYISTNTLTSQISMHALHSGGASADSQRAQTEQTARRQQTTNKRILVVEDSTTTRKMVRSIIENAGYDVVEAVDGIDGLEKLKNNGPFNLMTVDINMPRLNGYGLTSEVRKIPEFKKFPIIMITTRDLEIDKVKGFEAGVDDYIVKPFEPAELLSVIKQYIK